jgi:predicted amidophosphoribosyltransferase
MRNRVPDEATCAICGRHFDPSETRGWCPNPSCGEWQHPAFPVDEAETDETDTGGEATTSQGDTSPSTPTRDCPSCGNEVRVDANFCKHCAAQLSGDDAEDDDEETTMECPDCGADLSGIPTDRLTQCPICLFDLGSVAGGGSTGSGANTGGQTDGFDSDTGTGTSRSDSDAGTDPGNDYETGGETSRSDSDAGTDPGNDYETGGETSGFGSDSGTDPGNDYGTGTDPGNNYGEGASPGNDRGTGTGTGTRAGTGTGAESESDLYPGSFTECPNCGEDLTPIPPELRTVCPGCRVDLEEGVEADTDPQGQSTGVAPATPLAEVDGIASGYVQRLSSAGVTTVGDLHGTDPDTVSARTGISARRVRDWLDDITVAEGSGGRSATGTGGEAKSGDESKSGTPGIDRSTRIQRSPDEFVLEVMGEEVTVTDGETVGREVRSAMVRAGAPEEEAVYVHRKHIRIERGENGFSLTRLGENGLTVNGRTVEKGATVPVEDGDEIGFSDVVTATVSVR